MTRRIPAREPKKRKAKYTVERFKDRKGKWRSRIVHRNGNIILETSQGKGYRRKISAVNAIRHFIDAVIETDVDFVDLK